MKKLALFILLIIVNSCAVKPQLTNLDRGEYEVSQLPNIEDIISVDVNIIPLAKPTTPNKEKDKYFFNLNDSTQTRYLEIVGEMVGSNPDKLIEHLKKPIYEPKKKKSKLATDFSLIKARLYLNNVKKYYNLADSNNAHFIHPNTRLSWLTTTLILDDKASIEVVTIDKLQSEYESINMGSIDRNQSATFSGKLSAQYGINAQTNSGSTSGREFKPVSSNTVVQNVYDANGNLVDSITTGSSDTTTNTKGTSTGRANGFNAGVGGEVGYANTEAINEAFVMAYNEFKTGFSFSPNKITVSQKGRMFSDISNTVILSATLKPKNPEYCRVHNFGNLFEKKVANPADKISVNNRAIKYISCDFSRNNLKADITINYDGLLRTVKNDKKSRNRLEYDDNVVYYTFKSDDSLSENQDNISIDLSEYCKKIYRLWAEFEDGTKHLLQINNPNKLDAQFLEDEDPFQIYKWILDVIKTPTASNLQTNKFQMYFLGPEDEKTYLVNSKISTNDIDKLKKIKELYFEQVMD